MKKKPFQIIGNYNLNMKFAMANNKTYHKFLLFFEKQNHCQGNRGLINNII